MNLITTTEKLEIANLNKGRGKVMIKELTLRVLVHVLSAEL